MRQPHQRTYVLRGYVKERSDGRFVGVCLRPGLVVEGQSVRDALDKLQQLTRAYLAEAAKDGHLEHFLAQRAPAKFYVEYAVGRVLLALSHSFTPFKNTYNPQLA